jgi:hypothetical protein
MREVKYIRWKAWVNVGLSGLLILGGLALAWHTRQALPSLLIAFVGAVLVHVSRLPLLEPDVLLRLTATKVWTKELGWQPWSAVLVYLERNNRTKTDSHLVIHRPGEFTPRFFENIAMLDIEKSELQQWLAQYARSA